MTDIHWGIIDKEEPRGQSVTLNGIPCTARTCVTELNRLTKENQRFRITLQEAIKNERNDMGRNVLKQLADNLGVDYD